MWTKLHEHKECLKARNILNLQKKYSQDQRFPS